MPIGTRIHHGPMYVALHTSCIMEDAYAEIQMNTMLRKAVTVNKGCDRLLDSMHNIGIN